MNPHIAAAMMQTMSNNAGMSIEQYLRRNLESVAPTAAAAALALAQGGSLGGGGPLGGSLHRHTQHRRYDMTDIACIHTSFLLDMTFPISILPFSYPRTVLLFKYRVISVTVILLLISSPPF